MTRLFYALILLFSAQAVTAAEVANLYQAKALVNSQSSSELDQIKPSLLQEVIVRVVGDRQKVNRADISAILADANRYIARYSYQKLEQDPLDFTRPESLIAIINFDEQSLNNALTRVGLPLWDKRRPDILFWLAADRSGAPHLYSDADNSELQKHLQTHAQRRGLPVLLPLMDLQDQTQISFNDIWTGNQERIVEASERYAADVIVTLRLRGNDDNSGISWQLFNGESDERWQSEGSLETALAQGIDELADRLGRVYAWLPGDEQKISIRITDINNFADYSRVMTYLNAFQGITNIHVDTLEETYLNLTLTLQGDKARFNELVQVGRVLLPSAEQIDNISQYRLAH